MPWYLVLLVVLAVMILPFVVGGYLARKLRMPDHGWKLGVIFWALAAGVLVTVTGWPPSLGIDLSGGVILVYEIGEDVVPVAQRGKQPGEEAKEEEEEAAPEQVDPDRMRKLIGAIMRRVNPGGVKEVTIREFGAEQIEIIIPRADENELKRIKNIVSSAGTLEFRILANQRDHKLLIEQAMGHAGRFVRDASGTVKAEWVPVEIGQEDSFRGYGEIATRKGKIRGQEVTEILVVRDKFNVNGGYLTSARSSYDRQGRPCVNFRFDSRGGQLFAGLTGNNLPDKVQGFTRKLGIILNGYLYSAPAIQSTIHDQGEITGDFTQEEVTDLVAVLNAGSLPTSLSEEPISQMVIGPTLGQDTIRKGSMAIGVSLILVLIFMMIYYRFSGLIACGALLMNILLILAIMITIRADFTLPGLAGLVLTVGMAVDANVLIYERIREELARDAALRMAIRNGFARATTTIVDANLTTLITATVLWAIGTDQIRGFAVVLWLGVVLSMFTAIFCARVVFDIAEKRRWITELKMMRLLGKTNIDFLGMRYAAGVVSLVVIAVGLVAVVLRGPGLLDIDFTGGTSVEILFNEPVKIAEVREKLEDMPDLAVSDVQLEGETRYLRHVINTSKPDIIEVEEHLKEVFGDRLATNKMKFEDIKPIEAAKPKPKVEPKTEPAQPEPKSQSRADLPSEALLASADPSAILLAQAEPAKPKDGPSKEEKPAQTPKAEPAPKEPKPAEAPKPTIEGETTEPPKLKEANVPVDPFFGGTSARLVFDQAVDHDTVAAMFTEEFEAKDGVTETVEYEISAPDYQPGDTVPRELWNVKIKLPPEAARAFFQSIHDRLVDTPHFPSSNAIGGKVARDAQTRAISALVASLLFIIVYIWIRFQRVMFGLAAVVALVHDVLITLGMIAISAYLAPVLGFLLIDPFKISLAVLAAFLTIIGYSLNDTIVVFDRIREVRGKAPALTAEMINNSINQTLSRTLLTSLTTLIVVAILYVAGGQGIHAFAFALVIGVVVGTYSSVFVASPVLYWMSRPKKTNSK